MQSTTAQYAFASDSAAPVTPLESQLLWRFCLLAPATDSQSGWALAARHLAAGVYRGVAVVIADLCSFSSFVRDTPDDQIVRDSLTSFYSKARYEVVNRGGMIENFVGDQVLALFGVPTAVPVTSIRRWGRPRPCSASGRRYRTGGSGRSIGSSRARACIGVAYGDLQIVALRPSSRTHSTAIADAINVAARLMNMAAAGEILVANSFYQQLSPPQRPAFVPVAPQDARNVGRLRAYRLPAPSEVAAASPGGRVGPGQ